MLPAPASAASCSWRWRPRRPPPDRASSPRSISRMPLMWRSRRIWSPAPDGGLQALVLLHGPVEDALLARPQPGEVLVDRGAGVAGRHRRGHPGGEQALEHLGRLVLGEHRLARAAVEQRVDEVALQEHAGLDRLEAGAGRDAVGHRLVDRDALGPAAAVVAAGQAARPADGVAGAAAGLVVQAVEDDEVASGRAPATPGSAPA